MYTDIDFKAFAAHFSTQMSQELCDYARDVAFLSSRYLFTRREGKRQFGYCTHCRQENETPGHKHGSKAFCASCGSACVVKASGKGRKSLIDEVYFVYYEKSVLNPKAMTARGIYAVRDYREDYRAVETLIEVKAMYLFEPDNCVMYERPWLYYSDLNGMSLGQQWRRLKSISSLGTSVMAHKPCFCSYDSIRQAVEGTPYQYSTWEHYRGGDMVKFFELFSKYPCVEYLTKLGMRALVDAKLNGEKTYSVVNWRAKSPLQVLKMTKQELKELQTAKVIVDPWLLHLRALAKKDGSNLTIADIARISHELDGFNQDHLLLALKRTTLRRLDHYLTKQLTISDVYERYQTKYMLLRTWNDYIADCLRLGLNTYDESVKFPKNLYRAHQNTITQIKVKEDEALRVKLEARSKALEKMRFEAMGFILRAATDSKELIEEGKALQHCVGTYARDYARGTIDLFVLRRAEEPDKPFYTMEIRNGNIVQCRGLKNCATTEEVKRFIDLFASKKLPAKKNTKVSVAV